MTPITVDSVPGSRSLFNKVSRNRQAQQRNRIIRSNVSLVNLVSLEVPSIENQGFWELHQLKTFLQASQRPTWLKFRKSSPFGGILGCIQTQQIQESKDIRVFSPPTMIVIFHLRIHLMNSRASNSLPRLVLEIIRLWPQDTTRRKDKVQDRIICICLEVISRATEAQIKAHILPLVFVRPMRKSKL